MQQKKDQGGMQIPEGVSEFYVNAFTIVFTPWDLSLLFGSVELPSNVNLSGGSASVQGRVRIDAIIRMSPQHAKASARALATVVEAYEKQFGTIPVVEVTDEAS